jgi:hypothetical protein
LLVFDDTLYRLCFICLNYCVIQIIIIRETLKGEADSTKYHKDCFCFLK